MKKTATISYHLFQFRGNKYVFDIESSAVARIDDPAYDALSLRLTETSLDAISGHLSKKYGVETSQTVLSELNWLERKGFFQGSVYDHQENGAYIRQLTRMSANSIELCLAEACNLRCHYCYVGENNALNNGLMSLGIAKEAVNLVFQRADKVRQINITFFGGEPLLNKPVMRSVIRYSQQLAHEQGKEVRYSMTTNATLLDDEIIGYIKRYNFGLMVSLDGSKEIHDQIRPFKNGQGSFEMASRNIKRLMQHRRSVTVRCTISKQCLDQIGIVQFLEDFGFTRVALSYCTGKSYCQGPYDIGIEENTILKDQEDYLLDRLLKQLDRGERIRFNPWAKVVQDIHNKQKRRIRCGVGRGCTAVGIDGRLYPCHRYVGMENYVLGDVSTGIDSKKFADYLHAYFETKRKCESCWAINICGGYCPWHVSNQDGTFQPPLDWWCEELLRWYEQGAWLYDTLRSRYPDYFQKLVGNDSVRPLTTTPIQR
ncbi:MAG: radical SAM protein [Candidatus Brocadia sp.]|nr:radical SAM protein [Candidatus Brocadia sp.]